MSKAKTEEQPAVTPTQVRQPKHQSTIEEVDALMLEKYALMLENLQLQISQTITQKDAFQQQLITKYAIDVEHDLIDLPSRTIRRGVK